MQKNLPKQLKTAYSRKERAEALIYNVINLERSAASSHQMTHNILKQEYFTEREQSLREIETLKKIVSDELYQKKKINDTYAEELAYLDTRYEVGQITPSQYFRRSKSLSSKIGKLKHEMANLQVIISVSSSNELMLTGALKKRSLWSLLLSLFSRKKKKWLMPPAPVIQLPAPMDFDAVRQHLDNAAHNESSEYNFTGKPFDTYASGAIDPSTISSPLTKTTTIIKSLTVLPERIKIDSEASIIADIYNPFPEKVTKSMKLMIDGNPEGNVTVDVEHGESKEIKFKVSFNYPGNHKIEVDSKSAMVTVDL